MSTSRSAPVAGGQITVQVDGKALRHIELPAAFVDRTQAGPLVAVIVDLINEALDAEAGRTEEQRDDTPRSGLAGFRDRVLGRRRQPLDRATFDARTRPPALSDEEFTVEAQAQGPWVSALTLGSLAFEQEPSVLADDIVATANIALGQRVDSLGGWFGGR